MNTIHRFDGAAAWALLTREEQAQIGALALEMVIASKTAHATDGIPGHEPHPLHRAALAAGNVAVNLLDEVVSEAIVQFVDFTEPPVPLCVGDICRRCGCTEPDACEGGCAWHGPGLCTACVPGAVHRGFVCVGGRA